MYPWLDARGAKVGVSLYRTGSGGTPDTISRSALWYETYFESLDGDASFSSPQVVDATPVKRGPICTAGIDSAANRELGDFQSIALDGAGRANLAYVRSIDNQANTEIRFVRQLPRAAAADRAVDEIPVPGGLHHENRPTTRRLQASRTTAR